MDKVKISEIAQELQLTSRKVLQKAKELSFSTNSANSTITLEEASTLMEYIIRSPLQETDKVKISKIAKDLDISVVELIKNTKKMNMLIKKSSDLVSINTAHRISDFYLTNKNSTLNNITILKIAKELGLNPQETLNKAKEIDINVKGVNNIISNIEEEKLKYYIRYNKHIQEEQIRFIKPKMVRILNSLSIDMVLIKKGTFMMGEYKEQEKVNIENDFYMGKYPVTIAEYMHFANDVKEHYPEWMTEDYYKNMNLSNNAPIIGIHWHDATAYCKWLSKKTGDEYKIPTEKEWEYACRAGTITKWSFGDDAKELEKYAWYADNSNQKTHLVGEKLPNPWGLYDMHGNIFEWCEDWYDNDKQSKVLRGGCWESDDSICSGCRIGNITIDRDERIGFRLLKIFNS